MRVMLLQRSQYPTRNATIAIAGIISSMVPGSGTADGGASAMANLFEPFSANVIGPAISALDVNAKSDCECPLPRSNAPHALHVYYHASSLPRSMRDISFMSGDCR